MSLSSFILSPDCWGDGSWAGNCFNVFANTYDTVTSWLFTDFKDSATCTKGCFGEYRTGRNLSQSYLLPWLAFRSCHQQLRQDHILPLEVWTQPIMSPAQKLVRQNWGDIENTTVIFPDPMGATGNTLIAGVDYYKKTFPAVLKIYCHSFDRHARIPAQCDPHSSWPGDLCSSLGPRLVQRKVLASVPGTYWNEERGLNDKDYIVPGGGGFGEIMNNSLSKKLIERGPYDILANDSLSYRRKNSKNVCKNWAPFWPTNSAVKKLLRSVCWKAFHVLFGFDSKYQCGCHLRIFGVSSYHGASSTGEVLESHFGFSSPHWRQTCFVGGRHCRHGLDHELFKNSLLARGPKSLTTVSLLEKPEALKVPCKKLIT